MGAVPAAGVPDQWGLLRGYALLARTPSFRDSTLARDLFRCMPLVGDVPKTGVLLSRIRRASTPLDACRGNG